MRDVYESQAKFFSNIPLLTKGCVASVHLENKEDEEFWIKRLQRVHPGNYYIISQSRSKNGNLTSGCEQCLNYRGHLSKRFFIAIDSDLRYVSGNLEGINAKNFIAQTYTYSWENHCCEAAGLQHRFEQALRSVGKEPEFDLVVFLKDLSILLYDAFLYAYYLKTSNTNGASVGIRDIFNCLSVQIRGKWLTNNGECLLNEIRNKLSNLSLSIPIDEYKKAVAHLETLGITKENVYLHVRGHNLFDLVQHIGKILCHNTPIRFTSDVLMKGLDKAPTYWQLQYLEDNLRSILL